VEEALLLMPVQRVVGGVEIEGDLRRRHRMGVEKQVDKQSLDRRSVIADLVIAGRLRPAQFQPVERRFAGQRSAIRTPCLELAAQHGHDRIVAQLVVVDQVLVAEHPLTHQARHFVYDQVSRPVIGEAARKTLDHSDLPIGGAEQHRPGLRGHRATVKRRHHRPPFNACKAKQIRATLCLHRDSPWS
jgi:hypothetical protein